MSLSVGVIGIKLASDDGQRVSCCVPESVSPTITYFAVFRSVCRAVSVQFLRAGIAQWIVCWACCPV